MQFTCTRSDELYHHGILGQKWGVRRYQNEDGTLTKAGKLRYQENIDGTFSKLPKKKIKNNIEQERSNIQSAIQRKLDADYYNSEEYKAYKKWRAAHPNADEDHFGDYMNSHNIKEWEPQRDLQRDHGLLNKDNAKNLAIGSALISSVYLAPISAFVTKKITNSGKKAVLAYLATAGSIGVASYLQETNDRIKTEKKYGLR